MKELALYNLKEGMVLAKDITTPSGQVVLEKGKELTKQSILRLSFYNIKSACIVDGEAGGSQVLFAEDQDLAEVSVLPGGSHDRTQSDPCQL